MDPAPDLLGSSVGFYGTLTFTRYLWVFSFGQEGYTSQRSNILAALRRPNIGREHYLTFFLEMDRHTL